MGDNDELRDMATLVLPAALVGALEKEAKRSRKSVTRLLAEIIEDMTDARIATAAYKKYIKSGRKSYSLEEIKAELGSAS